MLDVEHGVGGHAQPLTGNLDVERRAAFQRVGQPAKLRDELRTGIGRFDISAASGCHWCQGLKCSTTNRIAQTDTTRGAWPVYARNFSMSAFAITSVAVLISG